MAGQVSRPGPGRARRAGPARPGPARRRPAAGPDPARRLAWEVLHAVASRGAYANLLLSSRLAERSLPAQDAALATELVYGTLRGQGRYDAVIAASADRGVDRIDEKVLLVLRLGTHQLLGMTVPPHAAVATSVDLARNVAGGRPAGFVNAVLRRVACQDLESWLRIVAPDRSADLPGHLAVRYSHPRWLVTALAEALGEDPGGGLADTERALAADDTRPLVTLAAVPGLASAADLGAAGASPARWSPYGGYLPRGDPGKLPLVQAGRAGVQDEASQLAALALSRADLGGPDARWLDLCAGPGGKARLLGGLAAGRGAGLVAAELHPHRARLVSDALMGLPGAAAVVADGQAPAWRRDGFDRVLADVPCSALGSLRRRPEARWRRSAADVAALGGLQRGLLASAIESARPGGIVGYVACSPLIAETRQVVTDVVGGRADVRVLDAPAVLAEVPGLRGPGQGRRFAQFWPHRHGTDAIFLALLQRC
jgi:16S rRNA (cytosine967-C5)-methyltransferase